MAGQLRRCSALPGVRLPRIPLPHVPWEDARCPCCLSLSLRVSLRPRLCTAEPVRPSSGCVRDDSGADRKPAASPAARQCLQHRRPLRQESRGVQEARGLSGGQDPLGRRAALPRDGHEALQDTWPGVDMNVESELLWPGVGLLLLLGTVAGLCVRCSRPAVKKSEKIYEQRSLQCGEQKLGTKQNVSCVQVSLTELQEDVGMPSGGREGPMEETLRTISGVPGEAVEAAGSSSGPCEKVVRQAWPGPLGDTDSNVAATRKDKLLRFSPSLEDSESSRYQNFSKGGEQTQIQIRIRRSLHRPHHHRLLGQFQKPREDDDDDDANSYENVLICKQKDPESGDEGSEDYQNSASIRQWRESRRIVEQVPREVPLSLAGSPDEDSEDPDYVNQNVAAIEA
ncbi:hypothetical protein PANDA_008826 [Ailuropoda melanoleuca]|uniref:Linker for activation of T cells family member 2 n=1 Tax=Ailuropoda melanoleuca TaxID=9646 RepID=D2HDN8_AILME|nr:hypothetical protein PANDA_008826 [Ailuropoda melanoleuca]